MAGIRPSVTMLKGWPHDRLAPGNLRSPYSRAVDAGEQATVQRKYDAARPRDTERNLALIRHDASDRADNRCWQAKEQLRKNFYKTTVTSGYLLSCVSKFSIVWRTRSSLFVRTETVLQACNTVP